MEVHFNRRIWKRSCRAWQPSQGRAAEALVQEAVERLVDYGEWFSAGGRQGLAAADRGEFVEA